ncbi:plasmid recombination protein [Methylotenera sp.]|uniref:plasmid recombination protein n=1 Tax=Methylotenera sp. TaxID=2051956 RepID=UPI0024886232|nr:plasmid recombination protein [Methylotenera sp.]MDI1361509.1 plasmid recombination protein [Methylotenera sp.]
MAASHLIRLGKIKGENGVLVALKHNKRTLQNERGASANIDATRTSLNYSLSSKDKPETIARHAKSQMILAGIENPRKDQVKAVEVIFSLPIDRHQQDTEQFFIDCFNWVKQNFSGELLAFDIHLDEAAPHAHALILPLIDGKMQGRDMVGSTGNLMRLINKFHADIARHYGLSRSDKKRLSNMDKQSLEKLVLTRLSNDPARQSSVWACLRDAIHDDPLPYAQMLSIKPPQATNKSFVAIMTSKGKGKATNAI